MRLAPALLARTVQRAAPPLRALAWGLGLALLSASSAWAEPPEGEAGAVVDHDALGAPSREEAPFGARPALVGSRSIRQRLDAKGWAFRVSPSLTHIFPANFDAFPGRVEADVLGISFEASRAAWLGCLLTARATYERRTYQFHGSNPFFPGATTPFDVVQGSGLGLTIFQGLSESWAATLTATVATYAEAGADPLDGVSFSVVGGIGHMFSKSFTAGIGAAWFTLIEDDPLILPGLQFDWHLTDRLSLALEGATLDLAYLLDPHNEIALTGGFDSRRFRLADDAPGFGSVVDDSRGLVFLRWRHVPNESVSLSLSVGFDLYKSMSVRDAQGNNARTADLDPAPFVGVGLTLRF